VVIVWNLCCHNTVSAHTYCRPLRVYTHTRARTLTHARTHTYIHTQTFTPKNVHTHARTHTHTCLSGQRVKGVMPRVWLSPVSHIWRSHVTQARKLLPPSQRWLSCPGWKGNPRRPLAARPLVTHVWHDSLVCVAWVIHVCDIMYVTCIWHSVTFCDILWHSVTFCDILWHSVTLCIVARPSYIHTLCDIVCWGQTLHLYYLPYCEHMSTCLWCQRVFVKSTCLCACVKVIVCVAAYASVHVCTHACMRMCVHVYWYLHA